MNNVFEQDNGLVIEVGQNYRTHVGDLVKVKSIDVKKNQLVVTNISDQCTSWHRIDSAIKDNKFKVRA